MRVRSHPHKLRTARRVRQRSGNFGYLSQDANCVFGVDFVPGIAWLVIVAVQAAEEKQCGYLPGSKRGVIAGPISTDIGLVGFKTGVRSGLLHNSLECRTGGNAADVQLVIAQPPDHIHIDHGYRV